MALIIKILLFFIVFHLIKRMILNFRLIKQARQQNQVFKERSKAEQDPVETFEAEYKVITDSEDQ